MGPLQVVSNTIRALQNEQRQRGEKCQAPCKPSNNGVMPGEDVIEAVHGDIAGENMDRGRSKALDTWWSWRDKFSQVNLSFLVLRRGALILNFLWYTPYASRSIHGLVLTDCANIRRGHQVFLSFILLKLRNDTVAHTHADALRG